MLSFDDISVCYRSITTGKVIVRLQIQNSFKIQCIERRKIQHTRALSPHPLRSRRSTSPTTRLTIASHCTKATCSNPQLPLLWLEECPGRSAARSPSRSGALQSRDPGLLRGKLDPGSAERHEECGTESGTPNLLSKSGRRILSTRRSGDKIVYSKSFLFPCGARFRVGRSNRGTESPANLTSSVLARSVTSSFRCAVT
jgi:hypothetical protein